MNFDTFAPIILAISQVVIAYLQKKHTDTSDSEIRMLKNMQADSQMAITRLQASEKENKDGHKFRQDVYNIITETAMLKIIESESIYSNDSLADALTSYFSKLSDFALTFYYSSFRNNVKVTEKFLYRFLRKNLDAEFAKLIATIKSNISEEKCQVIGNAKSPVNFIDLLSTKILKNPTIFDLNELLLMRLVQNGIKEEDLKAVFVKYTDDFIETLKQSFINFNKLKDFDIELDEKM